MDKMEVISRNPREMPSRPMARSASCMLGRSAATNETWRGTVVAVPCTALSTSRRETI